MTWWQSKQSIYFKDWANNRHSHLYYVCLLFTYTFLKSLSSNIYYNVYVPVHAVCVCLCVYVQFRMYVRESGIL